jgi:hypothetical protein
MPGPPEYSTKSLARKLHVDLIVQYDMQLVCKRTLPLGREKLALIVMFR